MRRNRLNEDWYVPKLPVKFSNKINNMIRLIESYNEDDFQSLSNWTDYLISVKDYISNRVIAWDYNSKHIRFPNGTFFIRDFGYNVGYTIKTNKQNQTYVYVFMMNLKPEEFGLKVPTKLEENKQICKLPKRICLTESQLKYIIKETIIRILLSA